MTVSTPVAFADALSSRVASRPAGLSNAIAIALLCDAVSFPDVDYVPVGDYAVAPDEMACGASGPALITGKEIRTAIAQATAALKPDERPAGGVTASAATFATIEAIFGLMAAPGKRHARVVCNLPTYRVWAGCADSVADSKALADGQPAMVAIIKDIEHTILRPTGKIVGMAIEWSAFKKALGMYAPTGAVKAKAPTVLGIKPSGKRYAVTTYIALADAVKIVAAAGFRTVSQSGPSKDGPGHGLLVLPSIPKDVAKLDDKQAVKDARAMVKEYHVEIGAALAVYMGGDSMPPVSENAKSVAVGSYWEAKLTQAGREALAGGARLHGAMSARNG